MALKTRIINIVRVLPTFNGMHSRACKSLSSHFRRDIGTTTQDDVKPLSKMPGPSGLNPRTYWDLFRHVYKSQLHMHHPSLFEKFGPIVKSVVGNLTQVAVSSPEDIEVLLRNESTYPARFPIESWNQFRVDTNRGKGLLTGEGEDWKKGRRVVEKIAMKPRSILESTADLNAVATDLIHKLLSLRDVEGDGKSVPNLDEALFYWSLESIGVLLYEERFGSLRGTTNTDTAAFVYAVKDLFESSAKLVFLPYKLSKYVTPKSYKQHFHAHDTLFRVGEKIIDRKLADIEAAISKGEEVKGFFSQMVAGKELTLPELYANVTEMMMASVDTTSNTMQFALHELARNPHVQDRLYQEITSIIPKGQELNKSHLPKMAYCKAVIKETLRMFPVAFGLTRITQKDLILGGYLVPAGTLVVVFTYANGRNAKYFDQPDTFKPERWLRNSVDRVDKSSSFASLPFGFGTRSCVGRRIAELEMQILLTRICQQFHLKPNSQETLEVISRMVLQPKNPVYIQMIDRET